MLFGFIWLLVVIVLIAMAVRSVGCAVMFIYRCFAPAPPRPAGRIIFDPPEHRR
jgi:hypothetical protein